MKYVNTLGLATVAAMVVTAFAGANSASATVLCTTTTTPCGSSWSYSGAFVASLEGSTWHESTSGSAEDECSESTISGTITNSGDATHTVSENIEKLSFTNCTQTTKMLEETGTLEIHSISGTDNGTVTASGTRMTVNFLGVSCVFGFGAGTDLGTLTGGKPATLDIHAVVPKIEGGIFCPSDWIWNAHYAVTMPNSTLHVEPS